MQLNLSVAESNSPNVHLQSASMTFLALTKQTPCLADTDSARPPIASLHDQMHDL